MRRELDIWSNGLVCWVHGFTKNEWVGRTEKGDDGLGIKRDIIMHLNLSVA